MKAATQAALDGLEHIAGEVGHLLNEVSKADSVAATR